jgi:hypothetical protein
MTNPRVLTAAACRRSAQLFNWLAVGTTLLSITLFSVGQLLPNKKMAFLPMAMSLPPIMIWLAASIFVYASIAHHPDARVRHYNKWAGYRYYGLVGFMTIFANDLAKLPGGWWLVWGAFFLALVPWSLWDIWRARREIWHDITLETQA